MDCLKPSSNCVRAALPSGTDRISAAKSISEATDAILAGGLRSSAASASANCSAAAAGVTEGGGGASPGFEVGHAP